MTKFITSIVLFIISIVSYADSGDNLDEGRNQDIGGNQLGAPIDDYTIALIIAAICIIAYVVYTKRQKQLA